MKCHNRGARPFPEPIPTPRRPDGRPSPEPISAPRRPDGRPSPDPIPTGSPNGSVIRLSDYVHSRLFFCPGKGNELRGLSLVPIAEVIDEKRLSAMADHPSMRRRSP